MNNSPSSEKIDPLLTTMIDYLTFLAESERTFGAATALLQFGRQFEPREKIPAWVPRYPARQCFANATKVLISRIGASGEEIHYAEGYAIDREISVPIQHAWLVDKEGLAIDPTGTDSSAHFYFGITFRTQFVLQMLDHANGTCGLLVNLPLMRRQYGTAELLEAAVWLP
ncbi:MAG: hypothetical protein WBA42_23080 [Mesorhizobium sp.]